MGLDQPMLVGKPMERKLRVKEQRIGEVRRVKLTVRVRESSQ